MFTVEDFEKFNVRVIFVPKYYITIPVCNVVK